MYPASQKDQQVVPWHNSVETTTSWAWTRSQDQPLDSLAGALAGREFKCIVFYLFLPEYVEMTLIQDIPGIIP